LIAAGEIVAHNEPGLAWPVVNDGRATAIWKWSLAVSRSKPVEGIAAICGDRAPGEINWGNIAAPCVVVTNDDLERVIRLPSRKSRRVGDGRCRGRGDQVNIGCAVHQRVQQLLDKARERASWRS